jgi:hypothetical protein
VLPEGMAAGECLPLEGTKAGLSHQSLLLMLVLLLPACGLLPAVTATGQAVVAGCSCMLPTVIGCRCWGAVSLHRCCPLTHA